MMMEVYESMTQQDYQSDLRGFIEKRKKSLAVPERDRCMLRDWADLNQVLLSTTPAFQSPLNIYGDCLVNFLVTSRIIIVPSINVISSPAGELMELFNLAFRPLRRI